MRANAASDFGRQHHFESVKSYADYIIALPLTNYSYFEPYIARCQRGDASALFGPGQKLILFALTSGTTAAAKYIPITEASAQTYHRGWNIWGVSALSDHPEGYLRPILQVSSRAEEEKTEAGIPCGSISGVLARQQKFIVRRFYVTPPEVAEITDATARYYTIMRLALLRDVGFISTANPSTTLKLAQIADQHAPNLIRDIHDGTLHEALAVPPDLRGKLQPRLKAKKARAAELDQLLKKHGRLLPQHYWDLAFLANWTGGTLSTYLPHLAEYYGTVPIRDIGLLASEGRITIPMADNTPAGILDITANFYEFVLAREFDALTDPDKNPTLDAGLTTLQANQLEKNQEYYIFLTNFSGLYRYNLGDRIRVTDHIGTTPVIEFLSKGAHMSSITGEKLSENQVVHAVRFVADKLAIAVDCFVVAPEFGNPPHYRLYVESARPLPRPLLNQFAAEVDTRLAMNNIEYDSKRTGDRLGPIEIRQLPPNLLRQRDEQLIQNRRGRSEQFKHRFLHNQSLDLNL